MVVARATYRALQLNATDKKLIDWWRLRAKARKLGVDLPIFKIDHTRLALDYHRVDRWTLPPYLRNQNVIFLIRDPRDVLVSDWFEKKYRRVSVCACFGWLAVVWSLCLSFRERKTKAKLAVNGVLQRHRASSKHR